jgi:putative ABC transport system permease protein
MQLSRHHFRLAARSFVRHKGFSIAAVVSLALAIALNTTMYSVIDALINPRLEIRDPDRIYQLTIWGDARRRVDNATRASILRSGSNTFEGVTSYGGSGGPFRSSAVEHQRRYTQVATATVAPNFFDMTGARLLRGRGFAESDANGATQPVVITQSLERTLFADGQSAIGEIIDIDGAPAPIVGVVGNAAHLPESHPDIYRLPPPGTALASLPLNIARLRKEVSPAIAERQLRVLSARMAVLLGVPAKDVWFQLSPMKTRQFRFSGFHFALIGAVVAVLLVACANLANLQLARGIGRSRELALRAALGASRRDIIVQLLIESAMLAGAGLVLGLLMTFWGMSLLESRIPPRVSTYITAPQTSWRVFAFAVVAAIICVMIVGLLPAIRVSRVDPNELLKSGAGTGANKKSRKQYGIMVIAEIGFSLVLLSGASIVVRSALNLDTMKLSFDITPLSTAILTWVAPHDTVVTTNAVTNEVVSRARSLPDVVDAAVFTNRYMIGQYVTVYGKDPLPRAVQARDYKVVSGSYLRTMRLRIVDGRDFTDGGAEEPEVVIDQKTATALFPGSDPIGERMKLAAPKVDQPWARIVGVVENITGPSSVITSRATGVRTTPVGDVYLLPAAGDSTVIKRPPKAPPAYEPGVVLQLVVRSKSDHERMPITLQRYLHHDGHLRLLTASKMDGELWDERASHDFVAGLFSLFAVLAIGLAALGIYGLVAHSVAERRREMGVRIALGASSRDVLHAVLREGNVLALSGVALGLLLTKYSAVWLQAFSIEDDQYNALLFAAVGIVLFVVALSAALIPALKATRIDPVESLRSE